MAKLFFSADQHFFHEAIIQHCSRPFKDVQEMNEKLLDNINSKVGVKDTFYILGDLLYNPQDDAEAILKLFRRIKCRNIHLIEGNYDTAIASATHLFKSVSTLTEIKHHGQRIVLCHYPLQSWHGSFKKTAWHLHGHSHGKLETLADMQRYDVGVDNNDFAPIDFDTIATIMEMKICQPSTY